MMDVNGLKSGKGKEYNDKGNIKYKGEYLNGERIGKGKEYYFNDSDYNGQIKFEGEFVNGGRKKGKEYDYAYYDNLKKIIFDILSKNMKKKKEIEKAKKENEKV